MTNKTIATVANNILGSIHKRIDEFDAQLEDPDERVTDQDLCNLETLAESLEDDAKTFADLLAAIRRAQ